MKGKTMSISLQTRITSDEIALQFIADYAPGTKVTENGVRISAACPRCGGSGRGPWFQDGGICYSCRGADTRDAEFFLSVRKFAQRVKQQQRAIQKRRDAADARHENKLESQRNWCEQNGHGRITFAELDAKRAAEREAERAAAEDCPTGRVQVSGVVLKTEVRDSQFGTQYKMTVKTDGGYIVWGSIPSDLQLIEETIEHPADEHGDAWTETRQRSLERGERVTFTATISPSDTDPKFGFFKRPASAVVG
jgi:hypothetical protein